MKGWGMGTLIRRQVVITGVVQGVGFRPHVARVAARYPITGLCGNDDNSVFLEVQGTGEDVDSFCEAVVAEIPPMASILTFTSTDVPSQEESQFHIVASRRAGVAITLIPADGAICQDCINDIEDPVNRRFQYPFATCTNCGPRLSIIRDVPYDRPLTTMVDFPMCKACQHEYKDPADRRYHAQPISCFDCGPTLWVDIVDPISGVVSPGHIDSTSRKQIAESLAQAKAMIRAGKILAVKGIGGFTLMCDARNETAVSTLRTRKKRPGKPFAVMVRSIEDAHTIADLTQAQ